MFKKLDSRRTLPVLLLLLAAAYALFVPALNPAGVHQVDLGSVYQPPSAEHFFGTDQLGRDVFTRGAQALRMSLLLAAAATFFSTVLGVAGGMLAASFGGLVDRIIMRSVDALNAVPHLLLGVVVLALWPGMGWAIVLSIALTHWTQVARIIRSRLVAEREGGYVKLAKASGASAPSIWFTHLIPAVIPQAGIALVLQLPHAIWHESALSFLGVGLPPQSASLGLLLEDARAGILLGAWWLLVFPAALLVLVSWSVAVFAHSQPPKSRRAGKLGRSKSSTMAGPDSITKDHPEAALAAQGLNVCKLDASGNTVQLLHDLHFSAAPGKITVVMGESGAGKSLLLKSLAGLLPDTLHSNGNIFVDGKPVPPRQLARLRGRNLVFVPSSAATALNPVKTVNSMLKQELRRNRRERSFQVLAEALNQVGLDAQLLGSYPHELSGGQAQRVVLALALISQAPAILLDEPTSALDHETRDLVIGILQDLAADGRTIVMTTHDPQLGARFAAEAVCLKDGKLVAGGGMEVPAVEKELFQEAESWA
ncbi:hypothetical protein AUR04nite_01030 [Glutamicibacter uratoxydans]|uniref:Peptide ABC transporter permease n=1 Tax=Glutamicibacter uratoxydans TaxID=43667 RepID=A0A4Y4DPS4_GLUUR|nr:ATP-binding cassette domain-containing protein [Glutamicibacter uratoxydans]GED04571.1 hypothetical protein AUR04nite_01030 [Glutamicibacter uratoxydans]